MDWVPGGTFSMGAARMSGFNDVAMKATEDSRPIHRVHVHSFWMDKTDVTNAEFAKFVNTTGYRTIAERRPNPADFPGVPLQDLVPGGLVFTPPKHPVALDDDSQWWAYVRGADWRHPQGPNSSIVGRQRYPVVQIAYEDAVAYARWAGKRLPTEAEWEFAARGGLTGKLYAWGDSFMPAGKLMANTFHGHFPDRSSAPDGYVGTSPVALYPPNGYGLYDMSGNVWQWVSDWYDPTYYASIANGVAIDPKGPRMPYDPAEPGTRKRVQRGGSFLCTDQFCSRYMVGTRGKGDVNSSWDHVGFRCVKTPRQ